MAHSHVYLFRREGGKRGEIEREREGRREREREREGKDTHRYTAKGQIRPEVLNLLTATPPL